MMKNTLFALLLMFSMAFSQFENTIAGWYGEHYYVPGGSVYSEGLIVADESTLAAESLADGDFTAHATWDVTNDFDDTGGAAAVFTWSANQTSTLTQTAVNQATAAVADVWYSFTYTLAVTTAFDGDAAATITTGYALTAVSLEIVTAGTYTVYFKSAAAPVDFVISLVSGSDTEGTISYDDLSLKQITGGNIFIAGVLNIAGTDIGAAVAANTSKITTQWTTNVSDIYYSTGKVGVGTPTPNAPFEVKGASPGVVGGFQSGHLHVTGSSAVQYANAVITGHSAYNTNTQLWYLGSSSTSNDDVGFHNRQNGSMHFNTNNTRKMEIAANGDVSIGESIDEATPTFSIVGDADSDAADVSETIALVLAPNADPLLAYWGFTSTQSSGYRFDKNVNVGGTLTVGGYTRHIDIEIGATTLGPTAPTAVTVGTFRGFGFDADNEEAFVNFEVPSDWDGVSDMAFELHWYPTAGDAIANGETVKWDATYRSIADGEAVDNGTVVSITSTLTGGASETDKEHYETSMTIDFDNVNQPLTAGDDLGIQFDRDVSGDSYTGAGIVYRIDLSYTSNTLPEN